MKRFLRTGITILLVAAAMFGGYELYRSRTSAGASAAAGNYTQVITVQQGNLTSTTKVVGELAAVQSEDLAFEHLSGTTKLVTLKVAAGNTVTAGQVLATIDSTSYQQALDQAQSDLQAAEKKLADLETPATALQIAKADLAVAQTEYQLQAAQDNLEDVRNPDIAKLQSNVANAGTTLAKAQANLLAVQGDTTTTTQLAKLRDAEATAAADYARLAGETYSDSYFQDRLLAAYNKMMNAEDARATAELEAQVKRVQAQIQVHQAQNALADAQETLADAQAGDKLALAKAQLAVEQAQLAQANAQEARAALDTGAGATDLAAAKATADKKRLAVEEAQADLDATQLVAPFAGTVLQTNANVGNSISANTTILTVADMTQLEVLASVDETTIRQIAAGQAAQITFDALPGTTLTGAVQSVPLQGTLQGGVTVYEVPISLEGSRKLSLLVGMTANVQIVADQVQNALLVPTIALQKSDNTYQVAVQRGNTTQTVPVEVGVSNGTYTQILSGLSAGDQVVVTLSTTTTSTGSGAAASSGGSSSLNVMGLLGGGRQ